MIKSMTGFGRGEATDGARTVSAEIKSVNHRYSEIGVRISRRYSFAEELIKKMVRKRISRGKTDVFVSVPGETEDDAAIAVNIPAARQYFKGLRQLQNELDVSGDITLELLATMPEVLKPSHESMDEDAITAVITSAVNEALDRFDEMRTSEGRKLQEDIEKRAALIGDRLNEIEKRAPELPVLYACKLKERMEQLLGSGNEFPEERLALEAAIFADRSNITEEIVRLRSHLEQLGIIVAGDDKGSPAGKKLDFLLQEMNRETNTIGSKANDLALTNLMLDIKSEIEKIREQIQNLE